MRIRTKLASLEKRMHMGDLKRSCPLCVRRPGEVFVQEYPGQEVPPSKAPPCPLCGKLPMQIVFACAPEPPRE